MSKRFSATKPMSNISKNITPSLRRRMRFYYVRCLQILFVSIAILLFAMVKAPYFSDMREEFKQQIYEVRTTILPWKIEHIEIIGNQHLTNDDIIQMLDIDLGAYIFDLDINYALSTLTNNSWVQAAIIKKQLPNTLIVELVEKIPAAIWQYQQQLHLIDINGNIITDENLGGFADLVHVVGDDAGLRAASLLPYLTQEPGIKEELLSAIRYGSRRWDLVFQEGFIVKMPEDNEFVSAWNYLLKLQKQDKLFNEFYKVIDLRNRDKYFIEYQE